MGRKIRKSSHVDGVVHYEIVNLPSAEDILNALAYYSFWAGMVKPNLLDNLFYPQQGDN